jgi:hypothetical protein
LVWANPGAATIAAKAIPKQMRTIYLLLAQFGHAMNGKKLWIRMTSAVQNASPSAT